LKKKILITGGSGLFGINASYFLSNFFDVFITLNKKNITLPWAKNFSFKFIDDFDLFHFVENNNIELIIHAAGMTNVIDCEKNYNSAYSVNVELTRGICNISKKLDIPFIYISTDHLYDGKSSYYSENSETTPLNNYALTKLDAEKIVMNSLEKYLIIRTNFYGWGTTYRQSFSDFVYSNLIGNKKFKYFDNLFYTPILIESLCELLVKLIGNFNKNIYGIWNIASKDKISKYKFAKFFAYTFGLNEKLIVPCDYMDYINSINLIKPQDMSLSSLKLENFLNTSVPTIESDLLKLKKQLNLTSYELIRNL
jgi:dTDP-4-dehydrorhamnose reductase